MYSKIIIEVSMYLEKLRELRENNDLYQKDLAKLLNVSQQYYSEYEIGNRTITLDLLMILADFYNTSTDYILGRTNDKEPYPKIKK